MKVRKAMKIQVSSNPECIAEISNRGCRTEKQYQTFLSIVPEIKFLCNNPFEQEFVDQSFDCSFALLFYNHSDKLCCYKLTPTGRISVKIVDCKSVK